jgi:hypothetical protein
MARYLLSDGRRVEGSNLIVINNVNTRSCDSLSPAEKTALGIQAITVVMPPFDYTTEVLEGPVISPDGLTETYTKRAKTSLELDADKDVRVSNATQQDLLKIVLSLENDNRLIKARINVLSPGSFTVGQANQITMDQLKTGLKALL